MPAHSSARVLPVAIAAALTTAAACGGSVVFEEDGGACVACVQREAARGVESERAVAGLLGEECQGQQPCADCVLEGNAIEACEQEHPRGAEAARVSVLRTCGMCGG